MRYLNSNDTICLHTIEWIWRRWIW